MNHVPGEKLEKDRPKMLATLISATRKQLLYTVRFVPCVALVGVRFLLESRNEKIECHLKKLICKKRVA